VRLLVRSNLLDVGIEGVVHASLDKVLLGVVPETLSVESGLEVLKGESIVEDSMPTSRRLLLTRSLTWSSSLLP
jgi:hypothetical protein